MVIFYMKKHLIILLAFSFIFFYCENSKKKTEQKAKGLILFTVGEIQRENQNLQANSVIEEKERIQTGNKSICDIQLLDLSTKIVARVKENTTFTLEKSIVSGKTTYQLKQQNGTVLFSINSKSPDENYQFMAPVSVVSVRGTKFAIETLEGKSSKLSVIEGKLAYRMRIPQIEDLPSPVIHSNQPLYKTIDFLESHEISLNQGEFIEIEYDKVSKLLNSLNLAEVLKDSKPETIRKNLNNINLNEFQEKLSSLKVEEFYNSPQVIEKETFEKLSEELNDLKAIDSINNKKPEELMGLLKKRNESLKEIYPKEAVPESMPVKKIQEGKVENKVVEKVNLKQKNKVKHQTMKKNVSPGPKYYTVQLGIFKDKKNTTKFLKLEKDFGFKLFIYLKNGNYFVQLGDFKKKQDALNLMQKLIEQNISCYIPPLKKKK